MAEGFVQVYPDQAGKQIDNDVVTIPAGTVVTDGSGNQTTLAAPAFYFRQRIVSADPTNPLAVANVRNADGPNPNDFGLVARLPQGQPDFTTMIGILNDIDTNLVNLTTVLSGSQPRFAQAAPAIGTLSPAVNSPGLPRSLIGDRFGRQVVLPQTLRELVFSQATTINASTSETTIITAGFGDTYNDLVALMVANTSATASRVDIRDQLSTVTVPTAGAAVMPVYVPAGDVRGISLGGVIIPQTNTGQVWTATSSASVTDIRVWALYIKNRTN